MAKSSSPKVLPGAALVPIERLSPGNNQRQFFEGIEELAQLIKESEWVNVLHIKPNGEIVAGERRWRACKHLNALAKQAGEPKPWPELPCLIDESDDESGIYDIGVSENSGRSQLRFIETARIMRYYRDERGLDSSTVGRKTGFAKDTVNRYLAILEKCHPDIIKRLDNGEQISTDILIRVHGLKKDLQLLRLEQWQGTAPITESETSKVRQRKAGLSRRKLGALVKILQESGAADETIQVAQFIAGMRETLPHKWHLKLSRRRPPRQSD